MREEELKTFIDVVINYFKEVTGIVSEMGIPYIKQEEPVVLDYTGIIGISGPRKGGIYLTAGREMLESIACSILGEGNIDGNTASDMVGELTNTIAGNVRQVFGSTFMISVPMVIKGSPQDILLKLNPPVFVIPIFWKLHQSYLVVGLE